jgi:hypothetical protein
LEGCRGADSGDESGLISTRLARRGINHGLPQETFPAAERRRCEVSDTISISMEQHLPEDLTEEVRSDVLRLVKSAQLRGWYIATIHWKDKAARRVSVSGKRPSGDVFLEIFNEADLLSGLRLFFTAGSPK